MSDNDNIFVFNMAAGRPACVLIAAAMGGNPDFAKCFDPDSWIIDGPEVEGLKRYRMTGIDQVRAVADHLGIGGVPPAPSAKSTPIT